MGEHKHVLVDDSVYTWIIVSMIILLACCGLMQPFHLVIIIIILQYVILLRIKLWRRFHSYYLAMANKIDSRAYRVMFSHNQNHEKSNAWSVYCNFSSLLKMSRYNWGDFYVQNKKINWMSVTPHGQIDITELRPTQISACTTKSTSICSTMVTPYHKTKADWRSKSFYRKHNWYTGQLIFKFFKCRKDCQKSPTSLRLPAWSGRSKVRQTFGLY